MASNTSPPSLAIIGSGIGGLALAIGLLKQNVAVTIYEGAPRFDAIGAGIGLGPNALKAMAMMDETFAKKYEQIMVGNIDPKRKHEQFEALGAEEGLGTASGWTGGHIGDLKFTRSSAHRKALLDVMKSLIPDGTVKFNKRVKSIEQPRESSGVYLEFYDGEIIKVDAVIGCDGIKGMSRQAVLGSRYPEEVASKYAQMYVYRGIAPIEEAKSIIGEYAENAKWFMAPHRGWAMYPISNGREANIVAFIQDKNQWEGEQAARECPREEMLSEFTEFDHRLRKLAELYLKPMKWPLFHHPDTPTYYNDRICLLGDSAHASTPSQAAGAGQGLEDALLLSRILGMVTTPDHLTSAFEVYDAIRRPRAQGVVRESYDVAIEYFLDHPEFGNDLQKITDAANKRLPLIWWHDLEADVKTAADCFKLLTSTPNIEELDKAPSAPTNGTITTDVSGEASSIKTLSNEALTNGQSTKDVRPQPAPALSLPESSSIATVQALDTTLKLYAKSLNFLKPVNPGHEIFNCPTMAFLITNQSTGKQILFDAGARKDYWNYSALTAGRFEKGVNVKGFKVDKGVNEVLTEAKVDLDALEGVVWSHWHFDHIGDMSKFPSSVKIVVGPGFKKNFLPGYPANPNAALLESDYSGHEMQEIDFDPNFKIGKLGAFDYFGDGSFYLLDVPGHAIGHICGLVRTTPSSFILLGADSCHFAGTLRPSQYIPLPATLDSSSGLDDHFRTPCPCELFGDCNLGTTSDEKRTTSYYTASTAPGSGYSDPQTANESVRRLKEFDASDDVFICIAHDPALFEVLPLLNTSPAKDINDWKVQNYKEMTRWRFLNELPRNGKPGRKPLVEGWWRDGKQVDAATAFIRD